MLTAAQVRLEAVGEAELDQTTVKDGVANLAEVRIRDRLITHKPGGMVEHVSRPHSYLDSLALCDSRRFR